MARCTVSMLTRRSGDPSSVPVTFHKAHRLPATAGGAGLGLAESWHPAMLLDIQVLLFYFQLCTVDTNNKGHSSSGARVSLLFSDMH